MPLSAIPTVVTQRPHHTGLHVVLATTGGVAPPSSTGITMSPLGNIDPGKGSPVLPGDAFLHSLASAVGSWALIAAVIGLFVGCVIWAFGSYSQNYQQAYSGRKGVLVSGLAALLIGAGPYLVNFFYAQGQNIR